MRYNTVLNADNMGGLKRRKPWEVYMALATLRDFGVAGEDKAVLGVGAGTEPTIFHLTQTVGKVVATDLYNGAGIWSHTAPGDMLTDPGKFAPADVFHDLSRLVVQHAEMRELPFEDNYFDGVFSSGSIEHLPSFDDMTTAIREIARVLKPGGILTLSTEFKVSGEGDGWDSVWLFDEEKLHRYLIDAAGLALVDELYLTVHPDTLAHTASLEQIVGGSTPLIEMALRSETHGFVFTSVHLAMRKPDAEASASIDESGAAEVASADDAEETHKEVPAPRRQAGRKRGAA